MLNLLTLTRMYLLFTGVLYHRWGKFDLAEKSYLKAVQLEPHLQTTQENLKMLYRKMGKTGKS